MAKPDFWNSEEITRYFADKPADPRIVDFLGRATLPAGLRVLDLGCGGGRHSELLASRGYEVCSVDVNPAMLETTRTRLGKLSLSADIREGSITSIPYSDESFGLVVTTGVLHQAKTTAQYGEAMAELNRVMKPEGPVLLNVFTNGVWDDTYTVTSDDGYSVVTQEGLDMTLLPRDTFVDMMADNGFELLEDQGEDVKMENTGPRAVFRGFFVKESAPV